MHSNNPYCAYHYHEINSSLCANPTCGEPIEGPCAVSFDGRRRFHLEHFRCEWDVPSQGKGIDERKQALCDTLLKECYWEVDGKVFCERHAIASGVVTQPRRENSWASDDFQDIYGKSQESETDQGRNTASGMTKAQKRTTRYMDLANSRF